MAEKVLLVEKVLLAEEVGNMRYKQIIESDYIQNLIKKMGAGARTGAPVPPGILPKGAIKSPSAKSDIDRINKKADQQLLQPGDNIPIPTGPNKEKDMEIDKTDATTVTLKNPDAQPGEPVTTTLNKKDLNPVITNLLRRRRART